MPGQGRYLRAPARTDERGVVSVPPPGPEELPTTLGYLGAAALAGLMTGKMLAGSRADKHADS